MSGLNPGSTIYGSMIRAIPLISALGFPLYKQKGIDVTYPEGGCEH